ncbi:4-hydroxy-tetrahydrodipicolinate synthase [Methylohalomonas lacus]|uniref:4-hydroxy-tetrahydrodipicolinate synthase n=1 Tax=Methylohalomonas lacus TaxID=398773 RepID=A0AAE3HGZ6_9GAMM|nr:4-hydroxy-tetrahydrodipicolinate synthase [Methylohalomonas lacus]MCS3902121.1 4-hydroxy-tetrahydrodipicolinate synthase [Methylohalomonas lacus]
MFKGSMVAIATPMQAGVAPDTALDPDAMAQLVEFHIENGTDAIVAVGTTGESATLDETEHGTVIRQVVEQVNGRVPVIAGTGANSTTEAMRLTRHARDVGADACLLVTPYYNKPTQEGLYQHYRTVAESVDIPQILYNVPGRTACDMQPETVGRLAQIDNIVGLKDANTDLDRVRKMRELCGDDFMLVSGDDATAMDFMLAGGDGVISVTANVVPKAMHDLCVAATAGDSVAAAEINKSIEKLNQDLFIESNPIPVKWALHRMGLIQPGIRLPLTWLSANYQPVVTEAMREAGLLN